MRLRRLDLTRYGKFTDYSIDFGPHQVGTPDLHIIYGLNEAGKSTSLAAYLDLLFGIGEKTRYGFLHQGKAMEIGGCLEFDGRAHELKRLKQRSNSLLDAAGQPVNEALLSVPLAGLTRDAYRTMFSLDDETLEEGGNAILESKGDLGELLFSASAGLAGISAALEAAAKEADEIFRKRASSTRIAGLKRRTAELKARRDEIDTQASAHAALITALKQAETAYDEAMHDKGAARARHEDITRLLRAIPLAAEYRNRQDELGNLRDLPQPPAHWHGLLPDLARNEATLQTRLSGLAEREARLADDLAALDVDAGILALSEALEPLSDAAARFSTAEEDLPKRKAALAERGNQVTLILRMLGLPADTDPETLLLPAATIGTLRDLLGERSGVEVALQAAETERDNAQAALADARAQIDARTGTDTVLSPANLAQLQALLHRLRGGDLLSRLRQAERVLPQVQSRFDAALGSLSPWSGDGNALASLSLPDTRQVEGWRALAASLDKRLADAAERIRDLDTQKREEEARIALIRDQAGAIDDARAQALLQARDAAWAIHREVLDRDTASDFEAQMHALDALNAARIDHADQLAELRTHLQRAALGKVALERQTELLRDAQAEGVALRNEIRAAVPLQLALAEGAPIATWLAAIERWLKQRDAALAAWTDLGEAQADAQALRREAEAEQTALAAVLSGIGIETADLPLAALIQAAETALSETTALFARRTEAEKRLFERERDLLLREKALEKAAFAGENWTKRWNSALAETWFVHRADSPGAVREILDALGDLPAALRSQAEIRHRIAAMESDRAAFTRRVGDLHATLREPFDPSAPLEAARQLARRFEDAKALASRRRDKEAELAALAEEREGVAAELALHAARKGELVDFFGVETLNDVSAALDRCSARDRLVEVQNKLALQITRETQAASLPAALEALADLDLGELSREQAELAARLEDLDERAKVLFAEKTRASDKLAAVGGDDAVARIESERRTIFLEIEDLAIRFLRLRTGGLVADHAIRAYRDKHRSAMMDRASEAFRIMTRGEYSGLATRPEKDREALIGLSRTGGSKLAADMSKGTRFQLYLALRLAGYEEFAAARPSVPFIADDIMETFDELRSEEVFRLFGQMAGTGQVIYLTHHRHLCEIARQVVPSVTVHDISEVRESAFA